MSITTKSAPKKVVTGEVRASYVNIFKTRYNDLSGKEEYSMMILIPKQDRQTIEKIEGAIETAKVEKWNDKLPKNLREPLKDGDDEDQIPESAEVGDEPYANHYFMNVKSTTKPGIVDADLNQVIDEGSFRSGDYCKVSIQAFAYDMKGNRGVSFGLNNVQVLRKGEPLGGPAVRKTILIERNKKTIWVFRMHIDFEAYSEVDIKKVGAWSNSKHPSTEVICMSYAEENETPRLWAKGSSLPDFVTNEETKLHAWNSFFEWCIWHNTLNWPGIPISRWNDTAALAAALALPRKLGDCGAALNLPQDSQKDKRGRFLIHKLCKPNRGERIQDPDLLEELYEYCQQDVIAERAIHEKLRPLSAKERVLWELDQTINIRGFYVDLESVDHVLNLVEQITEKLNCEVSELTEGKLQNTTQRQKILDYVTDELEFPLERFDKNYLAKVLEDKNLPPIARRVIEIRQTLGKTSTAKYKALKQVTSDNSRVC